MINIARFTTSSFLVEANRWECGETKPTHQHAEPFLCVVTAGGYLDDCGKAFRRSVDIGHALIHPPGAEHSIECGADGCAGYAVYPHTHWVLREEYSQLFASYRFSNSPAVLVSAKKLDLAFDRIRMSNGGPPTLADLLDIESAILDLLVEFVRGQRRKPLGDWLGSLRHSIDQNPFFEWRLSRLAALAGRHPIHVGRAFRDRYGEAIGQYFRRRRLEQCRQLVDDGRLPLIEIANRAGFADQSHFSREFKKFFGHSPGKKTA